MSQYVSFVIQSWPNEQDGTMGWGAYRVQDEAEIRLPATSFVVRVWTDENKKMVRGLIRHVQSGREMQFQSGERAIAFMRACVGLDPVNGREHELEELEGLEIEGLSDGQTL